MGKYIDIEKLKVLLSDLKENHKQYRGDFHEGVVFAVDEILDDIEESIGSLQAEQSSLPDNLDEAAFEYENTLWEDGCKDCGYSPLEVFDAFKAGAEWMAEKAKQEQPEDIVVIAKTFLDALSKTPYNNIPITDAQIIVKQLLLFFENPKEYNPDAILEQPEVDLEKEILEYIKECLDVKFPTTDIELIKKDVAYTARHFYELGMSVMRERITNPYYNQKVIEKIKSEYPMDESNARKEE